MLFSTYSPRPITPVKADCLEVLLNGYSFPLKNYLLQGFNFGFRVHFEGERRGFVPPNLKSDLAQPDIVREKLKKEITAGRIAGPFQDPPFPHMFCSPLGIVPKKNPSEFRLIHHLSFPRGFDSLLMTLSVASVTGDFDILGSDILSCSNNVFKEF